MSIAPPSPRSTVITLGAASAGPFDLTFRLFGTPEVDVYINRVRTTNFTITATFADGVSTNGQVTLLSPAPSGAEIIIDSGATPRRDLDFTNNDQLVVNLNNEQGRIWGALQDLERDVGRSFRGLDALDPLTETFDVQRIADAEGYAIRAEDAAAVALTGQPFRVPTQAQLTRPVYASPVGNQFIVTTDDIVDVPSVASYQVAASGTPPVAPYIQPAGAAVLRVLPDGRSAYSTKSFGTGNLSDQFARAMAAVKEDRDKTDLFYNDTPALFIPRGVYDLDAPLLLTDLTDFHLYAKGAVIRSLTEAFTPFTMIAVRRSHIEGLTLDLRNNNVAAQGFHMAGSNGWNEITNLSVQSNSSNAAFAAVRMQQGTVGGLTDGVRDNGNFWTKFENLWLRKLSGGDPNISPIGVDIQGAQNATVLSNCAFGNIQTGIMVRNQNNSLTSGMSNDIQLLHCRFEGFTTGFKFQADGGATGGMASFAAFGCRFEAGTTCFENASNNQGSGPMVIVGTTRISSVTNLTVDARAVKDSFVVIGGGSTPKAPNNFTNYERTKFANLGGATDGPTIEMLPRAPANGGNIALIRTDGTTVDGKISQRVGGGLAIDGGTTGAVVLKNVAGLSGSFTDAENFRGSVTLAGGATSVAVTFPNAEPDATYWVFTEFQINNGGAWITAKGTGGFTINVATGFASASTVRWMIIR